MSRKPTSLQNNNVDTLDVSALRREFPALVQEVDGHSLVYLDNAATTQKPRAVIDALRTYYERDNANIHRGVHALSVRATGAYETAREKVSRFVGAAHAREIVFVRGTTEAINLVASSWGSANIKSGDTIVLTGMEHHSNIVPWQMLRARTGATLRIAPLTSHGEIDLDAYRALFQNPVKFVALAHVSNAIGTVNPVAEMAGIAHDHGAIVLVDGAQAAAHLAIDVQKLGADFYALSGHKMYGPTGIGALYARSDLLEAMPPWQGGGDMIASVTFAQTTYNVVPHRFEAGTPNIAGAIGFGAAIDYIQSVGFDSLTVHEQSVLDYAVDAVGSLDGVRLIGTPVTRAGVISFVMDGVHPHDAGTVLDGEGIAVRAGHHCSQPLMDFFGVPATTRASFGVYNTHEEVDRLVAGIIRVQELFH